MIQIVGVKFKNNGKLYFFDPGKNKYQKNQMVMVETSLGLDCGKIVIPNKNICKNRIKEDLKPILGCATPAEIRKKEEISFKEKKAFNICNEIIKKNHINMKLFDVDYAFKGGKYTFYFTAEGRVDFRELVKTLAGIFKARIELRQIGIRDKAKMLGGIGICGRPFCCSNFMEDFHPVSIKMAKEQSLSLNPTKISGTCGRLMCCLKFEQEAYTDLLKNTPRIGENVLTPQGQGTVIENNLINGMLKIALKTAPQAAPIILNRKDVVRSKKDNI